MKTIRIGILGFAHGHVNAYCRRWRENPVMGVEPVAGWDENAQRKEEHCRTHKLRQAATAEDLLGDKTIDAVVIAAETARHAGLVEQVAAAGKTIVLQKPLALNMDEAERIVNAVEKHGAQFSLAWQMRVDPHNLQIRDLLAGGRFGRIFMIRRRHCLSTHLWPGFEDSWHVQADLNRDIFADDAAHPIDFIYWLAGMPDSVVAEMGTLRNPRIVNDNAIALFRYADGRFAEVSCTFTAPAGEHTVEIICENGIIVGNYGDQVSCMVPRPPGGIQLKWFLQGDAAWTVSDLPDIYDQGERISGLAGPLADFLHGRRPPLATAAEGRDVLRLTLACYQSDREGKRIHF